VLATGYTPSMSASEKAGVRGKKEGEKKKKGDCSPFRYYAGLREKRDRLAASTSCRDGRTKSLLTKGGKKISCASLVSRQKKVGRFPMIQPDREGGRGFRLRRMGGPSPGYELDTVKRGEKKEASAMSAKGERPVFFSPGKLGKEREKGRSAVVMREKNAFTRSFS